MKLREKLVLGLIKKKLLQAGLTKEQWDARDSRTRGDSAARGGFAI